MLRCGGMWTPLVAKLPSQSLGVLVPLTLTNFWVSGSAVNHHQMFSDGL